MKAIVTGGAGFIGSHLVERLLEENFQVTVVDNLTTGKHSNLTHHPHLNFLQKDILDCTEADFSPPIDAIIHLAAIASVNRSWLQPLEAHRNNLSATLAAIALCKTLSIPKLIFASSAAVYGNPIQLPIAESHPTQPLSPYGLQKLCSEQYINLFAQQYNFAAINLRFFNAFGLKQNPNSPYSGVISIFINRMRQGLPITIFGDGNQTRDFIYVKDISKALYQALVKPRLPGSSLTCNLGGAGNISLLDLVAVLKECLPQWDNSINFTPARPGDIVHSQANISIAASELDFKPDWPIKRALSHLLRSQSLI